MRKARFVLGLLPALTLLLPGIARAEDLPAVNPSWTARVGQTIEAEEYRITSHEGSWQAPNRAHGIRTSFTESGIRVVPRLDMARTSWAWGLSLVSWGRSGAMQKVEAARPHVDGGRIDYDRGLLNEWYLNDARGLEQGFTLPSPPSKSVDSPVTLELALGGTLSPVVSEDGQAIDFVTPAGARVLHYAALLVHDANGRILPAWMEGFSGPETPRGIRILFDDRQAIYPVSVDPLATSPSWTAEPDHANAHFGSHALSTAGDVNGDGYSDVIVGAFGYDTGGRAFLYLGSASGLATTAGWFVRGTDLGVSGLGDRVGTAGDVNGDGYSDVLVGAYGGIGYLFLGSASGPSLTPAWTANILAPVGSGQVATAGDVNGDGYSDVIVSGWDANGGQGRAHVYLGSPSGLATSPAWTVAGDAGHGNFGYAVATAGDVNGDGYSDVVVGAPTYANGQTNEGKAYVYLGSSSGLSATPVWSIESNQVNVEYGVTVGTAGDVNGDGYSDTIIGAPFDSTGGRAYVYLGSASGPATSAAWTGQAGQAGARFGYWVGTAGDVNSDGYADVVVGAPNFSNGPSQVGRAYVYYGSAAGLSTTPAWTAESDQDFSFFGDAVGTAGDVNGDGHSDVIVAADSYDNVEVDEGRVYAYHGSPSGLSSSAGWSVEGEEVNAQEGWSVGSAGDVNGDGYADAIVGIPLFDGGDSDEGRAYLYFGSAAGLSFTPAWSTESNRIGSQFGYSVGTAGDVNGDGYADVVIGAPFWVNGQAAEGRAYLYLGSAAGLATSPAWTVEINQTDANLGWSVGTAGDVNGDGYADVIIGSLAAANGQTNEGRAFVYHGSAAGLPASASWIGESNQAGASFGAAVGAAGDVDGDGYGDVIIGAPFFDTTLSNEGRAFVYRGSASGLGTTPSWMKNGQQGDANYGRSVGTAGDVNGDGYADVIVGAPEYDNTLTDEGRAYVYLGSTTGPATTPAWVVDGSQAGARLGTCVGTAGDVNGDGFADVIVGADQYVSSLSQEGGAFVYTGSAAGLSPLFAWIGIGGQAGAKFGHAAAAAGDVNGDGYSDVIVGAPYFDDASVADRGSAYLFYGNGGRGMSRKLLQYRLGDARPIPRLGLTDSPSSFGIGAGARTPFGRGKVKLEWEIKGLRSPFDGGATHVSPLWSDSGTGTGQLQVPVSDPSIVSGASLHWRVRLHYKMSTTPFQLHGPWHAIPWSGWNEAMLRAAFAAAGSAADGSAGEGLQVAKVAGGQIQLDWEASCVASDTDYEVYEGTIGSFGSHTPRFCSTSGNLTATFTPLPGNQYFLIVPRNLTREGSFGMTSAGVERSPGPAACFPQLLGACP